jgi:hypothetical protein
MSNSISTLLLHNLSDVFAENDPGRRRAAIDEIFQEDAVFYDPKGGIFRGRDEIDHIAGVIKATHPDFEYQPLFPPEELGDAGRVRWVSGTPGKPPAYAGTDFIAVVRRKSCKTETPQVIFSVSVIAPPTGSPQIERLPFGEVAQTLLLPVRHQHDLTDHASASK